MVDHVIGNALITSHFGSDGSACALPDAGVRQASRSNGDHDQVHQMPDFLIKLRRFLLSAINSPLNSPLNSKISRLFIGRSLDCVAANRFDLSE